MDLSPEQLAYADKLFKLRVLSSDGQAYENLFVEVMTLHDPTFRPVKPQGPIGDRKNDGYSSARGAFHQVYAPEHAEENVTTAVKKLEADFAGLLAFWNTICPVREFRFVLNDKFKGTYPPIEAALLKLKTTHNLPECCPFLNKDLMRVFGTLNARDVIGVTGHLPSAEAIPDLDYSVFTDVLRHVITSSPALVPAEILRAPDFSEKIAVNKISPAVSALLTAGNLQSGAVESFFGSNSGFSKKAVRDKLAEHYVTLRNRLDGAAATEPSSGDLIFFGLLEAVTPAARSEKWQGAAIVLLGYFFESCDIYEDPNLV